MKQLSIFAILTMFTVQILLAEGTQPPGAGTSGDPYQISTMDHLLWLVTNTDKWQAYYIQTADIDYDSGVSVTNCFSTGTVSGTYQVGGLLGFNDLTVSGCYSTCNVSGTGIGIGGLIGIANANTISNCYSRGNVSGNNQVGAFAGYCPGATVSKCYSTGTSSGSSNVGAFIGYNGGTVSDCFWDTQTSSEASTGIGSGTTTGVLGKTSSEMKTLATFTATGWDFEIETTNGTNKYWDIDGSASINAGYPFLSWQNGGDISLPVTLSAFQVSAIRNGAIDLMWVTESEVENLGFILERRLSDGSAHPVEWIEIASYLTHAELRGQGSVSHQSSYAFEDNTVEADRIYDYRLADVSYAGQKSYHFLQLMDVKAVTQPDVFLLQPAYPNPFNPETRISYSLTEAVHVRLEIINTRGQLIQTLADEIHPAGEHSESWNGQTVTGEPLSAGIYLCRLLTDSGSQTIKLMYLR